MTIKHFSHRLVYLAAMSAPALLSGQTIEVGPGKAFTTIAEAAGAAQPGDTLLVYPAAYNGGMYIENLKGESGAWITIRGVGDTAVSIVGGNNAIQFSDPAYLRLENLRFTQQTGNGLNIDDGGSYQSPAIHLEISHCIFEDIAATGNNDLLKMSGVDSFLIEGCIFRNGAAGGSGIDMVGCHIGTIRNNLFENLGSNSIQAKGGTRWVTIHANTFLQGGQRTLNLGGSTGAAFFRPPGANYEAADLEVTANVIQGSWAAVAFVGSQRVKVWNNTIYLPQNWVMRILQESPDTSFYQAVAYGEFVNNIIVMGSSLSTVANIGPNTNAKSFLFSHNLWFHKDNPAWPGPVLPSAETSGLIQADPTFLNIQSSDLHLQPGSPAIGSGKTIPFMNAYDREGKPYLDPPSRGAFEGGLASDLQEPAKPTRAFLWPNPAKEIVSYQGPAYTKASLTDLEGRPMRVFRQSENPLDLSGLNEGMYWLHFSLKDQTITLPLVILP